MAMGGKATAIDVICGLKRRLDCGQYAPWLPSKLDEGLSKDVERTLTLLLNMLLAPEPDEEEQPFDELGACMAAIKVALYELENLLDDLDEHGSVRRRPGRPTWKVTEKKCKNPPPTILKVHSLVYDFLRYIAADDIFTLDYAKSPNVCVRNLPFWYAVLTNYSWQATMHEDLIAKAKVAKAAIFRNCEATMPIADIFSILRYSRLLDLSGCLFQQLPTSIGEMKHLRYLNISCFRITELPNEMCCLRSLEYLDLSKTCIKVLPLFVGTFDNLKYFNLHGCGKLKNLPRNLGDLKRLEHLNLSCCPEIGELPSSISGLRELKSLNLSSCTKLELLPHQFGNLSRLETLELARCCNLQRLPESFGGLSKLCYLSLASCSRLQRLPDCIGELCSLEYLNISHVHLELPDSLSKLQSLHIVNS